VFGSGVVTDVGIGVIGDSDAGAAVSVTGASVCGTVGTGVGPSDSAEGGAFGTRVG